MRFDGAARRLVELGEREGGEQSVSARALMLRDLDSGLVSRCSGLWIVGIEFEQEVATEAMQEGFGVVLPTLLGCRQTFVDRRLRTLGVAAANSSSARRAGTEELIGDCLCLCTRRAICGVHLPRSVRRPAALWPSSAPRPQA